MYLVMTGMLLFDIDNTLIRSSRSHPRAFHAGFSTVFGVRGDVESINPHGKTDLQIAIEFLRQNGVDEERIHLKLKECMDVIARAFSDLVREEELIVLDGVCELLEILSSRALLLGLVTGNLESIAWEKLRRTELKPYFRFGGFGSDDSKRSRLVRIAIDRAAALQTEISRDNIFLIGDTPHDIQAGREAGVHTIGVATGIYPVEELDRHNPDAVLQSLKPSNGFIQIIDHVSQ
jgi:phosphoglycolate phosphatase-like HAD superfamily hydrolase